MARTGCSASSVNGEHRAPQQEFEFDIESLIVTNTSYFETSEETIRRSHNGSVKKIKLGPHFTDGTSSPTAAAHWTHGQGPYDTVVVVRVVNACVDTGLKL